MIANLFRKLFIIGPILLFLFLANVGSAFFIGFLSSLGGSFSSIGLSQLNFDPLITIAYVMLYYFLTLFYQPDTSSQYKLFLFTLFLSFTVSFMQGAIFLVLFYFLLRKARIC